MMLYARAVMCPHTKHTKHTEKHTNHKPERFSNASVATITSSCMLSMSHTGGIRNSFPSVVLDVIGWSKLCGRSTLSSFVGKNGFGTPMGDLGCGCLELKPCAAPPCAAPCDGG